VTVTIRAAKLSFDTNTVRVPVGATVTATLHNDDEGVEHNLTFSLAGLAHGDTCKGPCTRTQSFTVAEAGSYFFLCTLHDMVGTFIVEP
jgi:plastocyanin